MRVNGSPRYKSGWALEDAALRGIGIIQLPDRYLQARLAEHLKPAPADAGGEFCQQDTRT
ncbi:hypothetical protein ACW9UR_16525 [Halovulum sp. GXIMD14794]